MGVVCTCIVALADSYPNFKQTHDTLAYQHTISTISAGMWTAVEELLMVMIVEIRRCWHSAVQFELGQNAE